MCRNVIIVINRSRSTRAKTTQLYALRVIYFCGLPQSISYRGFAVCPVHTSPPACKTRTSKQISIAIQRVFFSFFIIVFNAPQCFREFRRNIDAGTRQKKKFRTVAAAKIFPRVCAGNSVFFLHFFFYADFQEGRSDRVLSVWAWGSKENEWNRAGQNEFGVCLRITCTFNDIALRRLFWWK